MSCSIFTQTIGRVMMFVRDAKSSITITTRIDDLTASAPASCSDTEKKALQAVIDKDIVDAIDDMDNYIDGIQSDLKTVVGSTATSAQIDSATFPAKPVATTTKKPARRHMR